MHQLMRKQQEETICEMREAQGLMNHAIKVLSRVLIVQTKKYFLFRRKYILAKGDVIEERDKNIAAEEEKEEAKRNFYDARAEYLKEKDIREELSEEVQYLAKKNNIVRKEKNIEIEARQMIIDDIVNTWDDYAEYYSSTDSVSTIQASNTGKKGESTREIESTRIKELENIVSQLTLQLKKRDAHLNFIKSQLEESKQKI